MIGKLIIFAILILSLYAVFIRLKTRITGASDPGPTRPQLEKNRKKGWLGDDIRISKIHMIITFLAALYLIWHSSHFTARVIAMMHQQPRLRSGS